MRMLFENIFIIHYNYIIWHVMRSSMAQTLEQATTTRHAARLDPTCPGSSVCARPWHRAFSPSQQQRHRRSKSRCRCDALIHGTEPFPPASSRDIGVPSQDAAATSQLGTRKPSTGTVVTGIRINTSRHCIVSMLALT